jgi:hypothetical protein
MHVVLRPEVRYGMVLWCGERSVRESRYTILTTCDVVRCNIEV